jgi:DNA-directed RNA polymerase specialized sigma24 family protein/CheY-like chemotaxis protein
MLPLRGQTPTCSKITNNEADMTLSGAIAHHLPMLRRFARALTGSQESGDAYVVATLEAMAESGEQLDPDDVRRGLFRALLKVWGSVPLNTRSVDDPHPEGIARAADRSLERMTPKSRVAFLLHSLEGFPVEDIGVIMGIPASEAAALQDTAGREIATMISTSVLIIEDEPIIAMDLESLVTDLGHSVTEVARTHKEALAAIKANQPGLVLADIHLADGSSGLDAVTGQRPEPTFLITKPFRTEVVKAIISQALFFDRRAGLGRELAAAG